MRTVVVLLTFILCFLCASAVAGQAASQPASQPVAGQSWTAWLADNWLAIAAFLMVVLPALITGLKKFPKASGVVAFFQSVFDFLSVVVHKDSPGSLKLPFTRSKKPE